MTLPIIETNNYYGELDETPYRLPSRFQGNYQKSAVSRSLTVKSSTRNYLCARRPNTSLSMKLFLSDEKVLKVQSNTIPNFCQMEEDSNPVRPSNIELSSRQSREQNKYSSFSRGPSYINQIDRSTVTHQAAEKLVWISELNTWLSENMANYDFLKLSKTATIHDAEVWKKIKIKVAKLKNIKNSEKENKNMWKRKDKTQISFQTVEQENLKKKLSNREMNLSQINNSNQNMQISIVNKKCSENKNNITYSLNTKKFCENSVEIEINKSSKNSDFNDSVEINRTSNTSNFKVEINKTSKNSDFNDNGNLDKCEPNNQVQHSKALIDPKIAVGTNKEALSFNISKQEQINDTEYRPAFTRSNEKVTESFLRVKDSPSKDTESLTILFNSFTELQVPIPSETVTDSIELKSMDKNLSRKFQQKHKRKDFQNSFDLPDKLKTETFLDVEEFRDFQGLLDENYVEENEEEKIEILSDEINTKLDLPSLPEISEILQPPTPDVMETKNELATVIRNKLLPLLKLQKQRWGAKKRDFKILRDLENEQKAEQRKFKMEKMLEKTKVKRANDKKPIISVGPRFETYGFLAKYCILKKINVSLYHDTFDVCDEEKKLWLNESELKMALKGVNMNLKDYDLEYLNFVMKLCDYNLQSGADFKLFAVLAALSIQITTLDSWIKNKLGKADFKTLEKKVYLCRKLWEVNVDSSSNSIPLSALMVELRAGGVKQENIEEINQRLGWMKELNFLDFLTYIPLFILLHTSIIDNPLDMTEKL